MASRGVIKATGFFAARYAFCALVPLAPLLAIFFLSDAPKVAIMFGIVPLAGLVPTLVSAIVVFAPIEFWCKRRGPKWRVNFYIPIMGGICALCWMMLFAWVMDSFDIFVRNTLEDPATLLIWIIPGVIFGVIWRISSVLHLLGKKRHRPSPDQHDQGDESASLNASINQLVAGPNRVSRRQSAASV